MNKRQTLAVTFSPINAENAALPFSSSTSMVCGGAEAAKNMFTRKGMI